MDDDEARSAIGLILKAVTPPPPGFLQSENDTGINMESSRTPPPPGFLDAGEMQMRAKSAPPPPGFISGGTKGRKMLVSELLLQHDDNYSMGAASDTHVIRNNTNPNRRSPSFGELAGLVGTGLAESIEDHQNHLNNRDSLDQQFPRHQNNHNHVHDHYHQNRGKPTTEASSYATNQDINFVKNSRHAGSRFTVSASSSSQPGTTTLAGDSFGFKPAAVNGISGQPNDLLIPSALEFVPNLNRNHSNIETVKKTSSQMGTKPHQRRVGSGNSRNTDFLHSSMSAVPAHSGASDSFSVSGMSVKSDGYLSNFRKTTHSSRSMQGQQFDGIGSAGETRQQLQQQQKQQHHDRFSSTNSEIKIGSRLLDTQDCSIHSSHGGGDIGIRNHHDVSTLNNNNDHNQDSHSRRSYQQNNNYDSREYDAIDNKSINELEQEMIGLQIGGDECRTAVSHLDTQSVTGNSSSGGNLGLSSQHREHMQSHTSALLHHPARTEAELLQFMWDSRRQNGGGGQHGSSEPSRTIVILGVAGLHTSDVRTTCEAFGAFETFRADFIDSRGIVFVGYYDIRSSQFAVEELRGVLEQLAEAERGLVQNAENQIVVNYSVPLNSSTQCDESRIVLSDVPNDVDDNSLATMLSSYGSVRTLTRHGGHYGGCSYEVEYHNVQDAKQALLELASSQPWGSNVAVEEAMRAPVDRKRGRELLALIGRWRHGGSTRSSGVNVNKVGRLSTHNEMPPHSNSIRRGAGDISPAYITRNPSPDIHRSAGGVIATNTGAGIGGDLLPSSSQPTQVVLGHDGRYPVVLNQAPANSAPTGYPPYTAHGQAPPHPHHHSMEHPQSHPPPPHQQQIIHGPQGVTYITSIPNHPTPTQQYHPAPTAYHHNPHHAGPYWHHAPLPPPHHPHHAPHPHLTPPPQHHFPTYPPPTTVVTTSNPYGGIDNRNGSPAYATMNDRPYYRHVISTSGVPESVGGGGIPANNDVSSRHHHHNNITAINGRMPRSHVTSSGAGPVDDNKDSNNNNKYLVLDLNNVESSRDARTSLMVRNIPNKYSQQMLLSEFTENGLGPGIIDFFYLPIDFKNRCNRGYAFINFVRFSDILPFHRRYFGKHWSTFNSDKICDITYARIQGKAAMLKRFENSALMEKDEEYKPLVFVSDGKDKGKRIPFPSGGPSPV